MDENARRIKGKINQRLKLFVPRRRSVAQASRDLSEKPRAPRVYGRFGKREDLFQKLKKDDCRSRATDKIIRSTYQSIELLRDRTADWRPGKPKITSRTDKIHWLFPFACQLLDTTLHHPIGSSVCAAQGGKVHVIEILIWGRRIVLGLMAITTATFTIVFSSRRACAFLSRCFVILHSGGGWRFRG